MFRLCPKWDPMYTVPNELWAMERALKEGLDNHELYCAACHYDLRSEMQYWLFSTECPRICKNHGDICNYKKTIEPGYEEPTAKWMKIYPSDDKFLREMKPRWLDTHFKAPDGTWAPRAHILWNRSWQYHRNQPMTQWYSYFKQAVIFYHAMYPQLDMDFYGHGKMWRDPWQRDAILSKEFREYLRLTPPGQNTPPVSESDAEAIYREAFPVGVAENLISL